MRKLLQQTMGSKSLSRKFTFKGSDRAYIAALEQWVSDCQNHHPQNNISATGAAALTPQRRHGTKRKRRQTRDDASLALDTSADGRSGNDYDHVDMWQGALKTFLETIPVAKEWQKKTIATESRRWALEVLIHYCGKPSPLFLSVSALENLQHVIEPKDQLQRLREYAAQTKAFKVDAEFAKKVHKFQEAVFVSWVMHIRESGRHTALDVDKVLMEYFDVTVSETARKFRYAGAWLHEVASSLLISWGGRCYEAFLRSKFGPDVSHMPVQRC